MSGGRRVCTCRLRTSIEAACVPQAGHGEIGFRAGGGRHGRFGRRSDFSAVSFARELASCMCRLREKGAHAARARQFRMPVSFRRTWPHRVSHVRRACVLLGGSGLLLPSGDSGDLTIAPKQPANCPSKWHAAILARVGSVRPGFKIQLKKVELLIFDLGSPILANHAPAGEPRKFAGNPSGSIAQNTL